MLGCTLFMLISSVLADFQRESYFFYDTQSSDVEMYECFSEEESCSEPQRRRSPCRSPVYPISCEKCLASFNELGCLLNESNGKDAALVTSAFNGVDQKVDMAIEKGLVDLLTQVASDYDQLEKDVYECVTDNLSQAVTKFSDDTVQLLTVHLQASEETVVGAVKQVNDLLNTLATRPPAEIVAAIATPGSPFQIAVTAAIMSIYDSEKKDVASLKTATQGDSAAIIDDKSAKATSCIEASVTKFANAVIAKIRVLGDQSKKSVDEILSASEGLLSNGISELNRRTAESSRFILNRCRDALLRRCVDGQRLPVINSELRANPAIN